MASGDDLRKDWLASSVKFVLLLDRYDCFEEAVEAKPDWMAPAKRSAKLDTWRVHCAKQSLRKIELVILLPCGLFWLRLKFPIRGIVLFPSPPGDSFLLPFPNKQYTVRPEFPACLPEVTKAARWLSQCKLHPSVQCKASPCDDEFWSPQIFVSAFIHFSLINSLSFSSFDSFACVSVCVWFPEHHRCQEFLLRTSWAANWLITTQ